MSTRALMLSALALIAFGALMRLMPHIPNATPITAIALVSSVYLGKRFAYLLPLCALFLSDLVIGFYDWRIMVSVYGSFVLTSAVCVLFRRFEHRISPAAALFLSSLTFFLVTNAAVWAFSPWYEKSLAGLLYAYELGLPFFRSMLAGDVLYAVVLIGAFEAARYASRRHALQTGFVSIPS